MACIKQCNICEIEVLDDYLCTDCRVLLANVALADYEVDRSAIKEKSLYLKSQRIKEQLRKDLEAANVCQTCGK